MLAAVLCGVTVQAQAIPPITVKRAPLSPVGQVPPGIAKIISYKVGPLYAGQGIPDVPNLIFKNTGTKDIRALVFRDIDLASRQRGRYTTLVYPDRPLKAGLTGKVQAWDGINAQNVATSAEIAEVVFADGTHIGSAPDLNRGGIDALTQFFEKWQGEADELTNWEELIAGLPADDNGRLQGFLSEVDRRIDPNHENTGWYELGVSEVDQLILSGAKQIRDSLANGSESAASLRKKLDTIVRGAASRRVFATDAGEA